MVQITVLKVEISCRKCKRNLIRAVSGLEGIDKIEVDAAKGILSVTGDVDPYEVVVRTRKTKKFIDVVTIGPPPKADGGGGQKKVEEKKAPPVEKKKVEEETHIHLHHTCLTCQREPFYMLVRDDPYRSCAIL